MRWLITTLTLAASLTLAATVRGEDALSYQGNIPLSPIPSACPLVRPDEPTADPNQLETMRHIPAASDPRVNIVYLVPADRPFRPDYARALRLAARSIQSWYSGQTGGKTFSFSSPQVRIVPLPHNASWYSTHDAGTQLFTQFWANTLNDAFPLSGGRFNDPENIWAYYIDADPVCGQCGGCGTSGVLVIAKNDLRGLTDEPRIAVCEDRTPDTGPLGRWIGGLGHELGHAFGLPHPPGCNDGSEPCDTRALMWNGFRVYPDTYLRDDEKARLDVSPFFSELQLRLRPRR